MIGTTLVTMVDNLPDPATPFGALVRERLAEDIIIWLTTVGANGAPQPNPVWFLLDDKGILVYNRPNARRLTHIRHRPTAALNLNSVDGSGVVVLAGTAAQVDDAPAPHENPAYVTKYGDAMARVSGSQAEFGAEYSVPIRISILSTRGF
jgi:PPOX class probable F420-dependent enzyme